MSSPPILNSNYVSYVKNRYQFYVTVCWFNRGFSQSRFPSGQNTSSACTLICLLLAQRISQTGILIHNVDKCHKIIRMIASAIIEGNTMYPGIIEKGLVSHPYLSTAEALKFGGKSLSLLREWTFQIYCKNIKESLCQHIKGFLDEWYTSPKSKNLFMLLITHGRTVLFIFQEQTSMVTFFDSHSHSTDEYPNRGLVVAQTTIDKLEHLCNWYTEDIQKKCYNIETNKYELAFLYPCTSQSCGCNSLCNYRCHCRKHNVACAYVNI